MSGITGNATIVPFGQRHAPRTFSDLVFSDTLVRQRLAIYASGQLHNSIILHGPFGSAKTTTALTIVADRRARAGVVGPYMAHLHAANLNNSLSSVVSNVNFMECLEQDANPYVVIDEVDQLNRTAQFQLRSLLDAHPWLRVILTTNEIAKVDGGVQSRCDVIQVLPPTAIDWTPRAQSILAAEGVHLAAPDVAKFLNDISDVRRVMRVLEAVVVQHGLASVGAAAMAPPATTGPHLKVLTGNVQIVGTTSTSSNVPQLTVLPQTAPAKPTPKASRKKSP